MENRGYCLREARSVFSNVSARYTEQRVKRRVHRVRKNDWIFISVACFTGGHCREVTGGGVAEGGKRGGGRAAAYFRFHSFTGTVPTNRVQWIRWIIGPVSALFSRANAKRKTRPESRPRPFCVYIHTYILRRTSLFTPRLIDFSRYIYVSLLINGNREISIS